MASEFSDTFKTLGAWLSGDGQDADIVVSSRVRLARNIAGNAFTGALPTSEREALCHQIESVIDSQSIARPDRVYRMNALNENEKRLLVERHLVSRDFASADGARSVAINDDETLAIMILEEDHLRIQALRSGFAPREAYRAASDVDDVIGEKLPYAFDDDYGYLTACPTNIGTGLRVSAMLHLPALAMTGHIDRVVRSGRELQLTVRGMYGEGSDPTGHFFQLSNQATLGQDESQFIDRLETALPEIIKYENNARQTLLMKNRRALEDKIWRAYGQLQNARLLSSEEAMNLLSLARLGIQTGLLPHVAFNAFNEILIRIRPAHLQIFDGREMDSFERDAARADIVRSLFRRTSPDAGRSR
ncbi:MAG: protein arginine kinase [Planctomycetota bacterium]